MIEDGGLRPHSYIKIEDGGLRPNTYTMMEDEVWGLRPPSLSLCMSGAWHNDGR